MCQRTTIEQTFVNLEETAVEALYTFPLPDRAAVCGFEVITARRVLTGRVEPSEQAEAVYDEAIADGHAAFMLEQNRPDIFTVHVGNLNPHEAVTVRITFVSPLDVADRTVRLALPTTIAPRYVTGTGLDADPLETLADGLALNPPHVLSVPYGLTLEVEVSLGRPVARITSPSHDICVTPGDGDVQRVSLSAGVTETNRDIVLQLELAAETAPRVEIAEGPDGRSYVALTFVPEFDRADATASQPSETLFVLDCSGSMQGSSIEQARAALGLCLRSLSEGDRFNICRFGSRWELMADAPVRYSEQSLRRALRYVASIDADLGGTELHGPLAALLGQPADEGVVRQVILLTDGQVTNEDAILKLAAGRRGHNRVFTFGIGSAASASLVRGIARATGGAAEFVTAGERIEDKVLRTFSRIASPAVTDVQLRWTGADVEQARPEIGPIFDGDVLTVLGRCRDGLPSAARLSCRSAGGRHTWDLAVSTDRRRIGADVAPTMWARQRMAWLEARPASTLGSTARRDAAQLVELSRQFNLLCDRTRFLAVEHRSLEDRNAGRPEVRRVPVMLAEGWGGVEASAMPGACSHIFFASHGCEALPSSGMPSLRSPRRLGRMGTMDAAEQSLDRDRILDARLSGGDPLLGLLGTQRARGWFDVGAGQEALLSEHGCDRDGLSRRAVEAIEARGGKVHRRKLARVVATVLGLCLLRWRDPALERSRRARDKAVRWLGGEVGLQADVLEALIEELVRDAGEGATA